MANVTLLPFVLAFFCAGRFAAALVLLLRRRSLSSSSSGSPSVLSSSSSSELVSSASTPLSFSSPRFLFAAPFGLVPGVNFSGFFVTRPDFRRALDEVTSPVSDAATAALIMIARYVGAIVAGYWYTGPERRVELNASCGDGGDRGEQHAPTARTIVALAPDPKASTSASLQRSCIAL